MAHTDRNTPDRRARGARRIRPTDRTPDLCEVIGHARGWAALMDDDERLEAEDREDTDRDAYGLHLTDDPDSDDPTAD